MVLLRQSHKKVEEARRARANWYVLKPTSMLVAAIYLLCLFVIPVARGRTLQESLVIDAAICFAPTLLLALLLAWIAWRLCKRSDEIANAAFCFILVAGGIWTAGLTRPQRADASEMLRHQLGTQLSDARRTIGMD